MKGKSYLIFGASSGIGLETARMIAQRGGQTIIVSSSADKLEAALESLPGSGHFSYVCDLGDTRHVSEVFDFVRTQCVMLDGMVYSAGISPLQLVQDNDWRLAERVYRINVLSFIECVRCFYNEDVSHEGSRIVALASVTAKAAGYRQTLYGSSKAALISAVKLMAKELLNRDIRVNCISPGCTDTAMLADLYADSDSMEESVGRIQPLGVIPVDKVAQLVVELLTSFAGHLTGSEIVYDAGFFLK